MISVDGQEQIETAARQLGAGTGLNVDNLLPALQAMAVPVVPAAREPAAIAAPAAAAGLSGAG